MIDPTGQILEGLRVSLTPEAIARRRARERETRPREHARSRPQPSRAAPHDDGDRADDGRGTGVHDSRAAADGRRPAGEALADRERRRPTDCVISRSSWCIPMPSRSATERRQYGTYDIYVPENLDERVETTIFDALRESLVTARVERTQHGPGTGRGGDARPAFDVGDGRPPAPSAGPTSGSTGSCRSSSPACSCSGS